MLVCVALLWVPQVVMAGYCGDLDAVQEQCLSKALAAGSNEWVNCDYCLCQEMGGSCNEEEFEDVLNCQVKADESDKELSCRLVLEQDWLIGFSVLAFFVGCVTSFLVYFYYKSADWSWLWNSDGYKYIRGGECFWDFITCRHLLVLLSFSWCVPIIEWMRLDYCNIRESFYRCCTYDYWDETCRPVYAFFCPRWLREICHEQPVFKPGKSSYDPSRMAQFAGPGSPSRTRDFQSPSFQL